MLRNLGKLEIICTFGRLQGATSHEQGVTTLIRMKFFVNKKVVITLYRLSLLPKRMNKHPKHNELT